MGRAVSCCRSPPRFRESWVNSPTVSSPACGIHGLHWPCLARGNADHHDNDGHTYPLLLYSRLGVLVQILERHVSGVGVLGTLYRPIPVSAPAYPMPCLARNSGPLSSRCVRPDTGAAGTDSLILGAHTVIPNTPCPRYVLGHSPLTK